MKREANLALGCVLGAYAYAAIAWAIAYKTGIPVAGGRVLLGSAALIGFVLDVMALAYAKRVVEATGPGDELREKVGFARILAWLSLALLSLMALLILIGPIASP